MEGFDVKWVLVRNCRYRPDYCCAGGDNLSIENRSMYSFIGVMFKRLERTDITFQ